jgi:hypothetical protein
VPEVTNTAVDPDPVTTVDPVTPVDPVDTTAVNPVDPVDETTEPVEETTDTETTPTDTETEATFEFKGKTYTSYLRTNMANGYVDHYYDGGDEARCYSSLVLIPGTELLNKKLLAVVYLMFLFYLFLGISIVADLFMAAIEVITSKTK